MIRKLYLVIVLCTLVFLTAQTTYEGKRPDNSGYSGEFGSCSHREPRGKVHNDLSSIKAITITSELGMSLSETNNKSEGRTESSVSTNSLQLRLDRNVKGENISRYITSKKLSKKLYSYSFEEEKLNQLVSLKQL